MCMDTIRLRENDSIQWIIDAVRRTFGTNDVVGIHKMRVVGINPILILHS